MNEGVIIIIAIAVCIVVTTGSIVGYNLSKSPQERMYQTCANRRGVETAQRVACAEAIFGKEVTQ